MQNISLTLEKNIALDHNAMIQETFKKEQKRLFDFIKKRVPSEEDAEDIVQDVFFELVESYRVMKPVEKIASWMFRVARNKIIDRYRKKKPESLEGQFYHMAKHQDEELSIGDFIVDLSKNSESELIRNILMEALEEAIGSLPREQRDVFVMHEIDDISFQEISDKTGVSVNTLLSRKRYAVLALRKQLKSVYEEISQL